MDLTDNEHMFKDTHEHLKDPLPTNYYGKNYIKKVVGDHSRGWPFR